MSGSCSSVVSAALGRYALANPHGSISAKIRTALIKLDPGLLYDLRPFWKLLCNHR